MSQSTNAVILSEATKERSRRTPSTYQRPSMEIFRDIPRGPSTARRCRAAPLSSAQPYLCSWGTFYRGFSGALFNCIAVGQRAQNLLPNLLPPTSVRRREAQFESSAVLGAADDPPVAKESIAQRGNAHSL